MFELCYIKVGYFGSTEPTLYEFSRLNYIFGTNNVGKTVMIRAIDFVLGKSEVRLSNYEGLDNISYIEAKLVNQKDELFLKRTEDDKYFYKLSEDSEFIEITDTIYKDRISELINRGDTKYLEDFYAFSGEYLTCRAFSFLNFLSEKDIGNIANIFISADNYYNQARIRKIMLFLFNYSNIKQIVMLERENKQLENELKKLADDKARYNYFLNIIRLGMLDLHLDPSKELDEAYSDFQKYVKEFSRDKSNSKNNAGDLTVLKRISCSLSEELKYQINLENQTKNLKSRNERTIKLLNVFKEILETDPSYSIYIDEINSYIEKQLLENDVLSYKDFSKTIETIKNKKSKIDQKILEVSRGLSKDSYEDILKKIGVIDQAFNEIKEITAIKDVFAKEQKLNENRKKIQEIQKEFDISLKREFDDVLNSYYARIKKEINFAEEDYKKPGFKIEFNPISVSVMGLKSKHDEEDKNVNIYNPGSNARMATWQVLTYFTMFDILAKHFTSLPIMKMLFIDGLNQPFDDTPENYPGIYNLLEQIAIELNLQLFVASTRELVHTDSNNFKYIDISTGFNKKHKS